MQDGIRATTFTTLKSALALYCVALAACSHAPTRQTDASANALENAPTSAPDAAQVNSIIDASTTNHSAAKPNAIAETPPESTTDPIKESAAAAIADSPADAEESAEPKSAEEAVAIGVTEQNLLDRMRAGFAMSDADQPSIDREVAWFARHDDYLDRTFRRAERYLYFIVDELETRKMPLELALLPIVESAFNPGALSRARAAGLWQFIPSTGRRFGLEQTHQYDGRRDIVESTRAALDYLQFLAGEFNGDWQLAVAAYNAGEMNVSRAVARNKARGRPTDFFNLDLPRETQAYVPKLLAMRRIVAHPEKYGLEFGYMANQPYFAKIDLHAPIDLGVAARLAGLTKEDMIALNPAHQRAVANADDAAYLLVPVDRAEQLRTGLAMLQSPNERVPKIYYTVHRGDTVSTVARKLGVSQAELVATNRIKRNLLHVGQEIVIERGTAPARGVAIEPPDSERVVTRDPNYVPPPLPPRQSRSLSLIDRHTVRDGETLWGIARKYGVSLQALATENKLSTGAVMTKGRHLWIPGARRDIGTATLAANAANSDAVQRITYVVRVGDTLSRIAKSFRVELKDLLNWNRLARARGIRAGQKLVMYVDDARRAGG